MYLLKEHSYLLKEKRSSLFSLLARCFLCLIILLLPFHQKPTLQCSHEIAIDIQEDVTQSKSMISLYKKALDPETSGADGEEAEVDLLDFEPISSYYWISNRVQQTSKEDIPIKPMSFPTPPPEHPLSDIIS